MYADFRTTNTHALRQIKACLENAASTFTPLQGTSNNSTMIGSHSVTSSQQSGQQPTNAMSSGSPGQLQRTTSSTTPGVSAMGNSQSQDTIAINPWRNNRSFFELCVNMNPLNIRLGEISLNKTASSGCSTEIKTDALFFKEVYEAYFLIRSKRWFLSYLYKPIDIAFVRFHVSDRHRVGIFRDKKLAVPPVGEVSAGRYHYYECPLEPEEPIDHRTFLHYFWKHESHHNDPCDFWLNRMPKKLHESILKQSAATGPQMGWGVHIIEGPNKPVIACIFAFFVILSFLVSVICAIVMKTQESGFGIGQWMVAALSAMATAFYFHLTES
ncbi:hypothetical protein EJ08DRAFT_481465 [Tothia fuscella]|uniref:Uncharacterized protein n=1 Tax=Tothia fuscella TaxID=1048955 RepID=A0A9P4NI13_9PEZI|nr:hypothetical protein EJ08DRAFT_481465 [Tothia fuscella]